ncbi:aliphatic sulfonate ABC transporter substrate-binding protein [Paenibacillus mucilaginosus]|uniref:Putative aliphatic sulfonates-binding protein n=1 Tax=Paenibacillus mucilaginosus (strain KNP414) TaxID=1036673 RepID=F8FDZ8_PAEMK|nr:aliphatic sulfonate ABC transporter substrate-binding protein [Paenibacillus mucilaginosus]AEI43198.1 aliphatic sulfonates family ABC transporter, periplasmic ligand-binding protein [Paenibacillus mucilaginosus KNP414]MCG7212242.1 aliphatic sulfonate ABC transporter substrate-binding protein [Paenibacillus mucilaginosus]WDM24792.1 aliphatic sulfonate ABC transporter substrate-binding protein [Paenibacillus mucilaginosus]
MVKTKFKIKLSTTGNTTVNSNNKLRTLPPLLLALAMVTAACGSSKEPSAQGAQATAASTAAAKPQEQPGTRVQVRVALNGSLNPLLLAKEKGWLEEGFSKLQADVVWSQFTSGPPLLEAVVSGRVDLSFLGDGAAITGISNQLPFEVIGLLSEGRQLNSILVPSASGIGSIPDLKGRTIGLAKGTTSHVYLIKALQASGLTQEDVKLINLQFEDAQAAFEAGKLDAWVTIDPYVTVNVQQKKAKALEVKTEIYAPVSMIVHNEFAKQHPELVAEYLKLFKQALDWQNANLAEAAQIYSKHTKLPADILTTVLQRSSTRLSAYTPKALEAQQATADILLANRFLKKPVMFKDAVNNTYVEQALR